MSSSLLGHRIERLFPNRSADGIAKVLSLLLGVPLLGGCWGSRIGKSAAQVASPGAQPAPGVLGSSGSSGAGGVSAGGVHAGGVSAGGAPEFEAALIETVVIPEKVARGPKDCDRSEPGNLCDCSFSGKYPALRPFNSRSFENANQTIRTFVNRSDPTKRCEREMPLSVSVDYRATALPKLVSLEITVFCAPGHTSFGAWGAAKHLNVDLETGELLKLDKITDVPERSRIWRMLEKQIKYAEEIQDPILLVKDAKRRCLQQVPEFFVVEDRLPDGQRLDTVVVCPNAVPFGMSQDGVALEVPSTFFRHTPYLPTPASIRSNDGELGFLQAIRDGDSVFRHPAVRARIEKLIGAERYGFLRRVWQMGGSVENAGGVLYTSSCQVHSCGPQGSGAMLAVDLKEQTISVGLRRDGEVKTFAEKPGKLPKGLVEWAQ
jgi:hypothetical protein